MDLISENGQCNNSKVIKIKVLFSKNINIPPYQRPYSWQEEQVKALIDDIIEAWEQKKKVYLVGNIIFHKEKENDIFNIVDGQQRLITFALMFYALNDEKLNCNENDCEKENNNFLCRFLCQKVSILSTKMLKQNYKIIKSRFEYLKRRNSLNEFAEYLENKVIVSYLVTDNQDEAFLFFDSQNTRGRSLLRKDLLKVHHVRHMQNEIEKETSPELVKFIKKWEENEKIDTDKHYLGADNDFLEFLFDQILGVTRKAVRRELQAIDLQKVDVYKEFRSYGISKKLNNYNQPQLFENYFYDLDKEMVQYIPKFLPFQAPYMLKGYESLPFEVTQSIAGGSSFFLFTQKYVALLEKLRKNEIFTMLDSVTGAGNNYLRKIYRASLVYFYDKFENELFEEFAMHLFLLLAYYRANQSSVYDKGVVKFQWGDTNGEFEIFKEILLAYTPHHIIDNLKTYIKYHCQNPTKDPENWFRKKFSGTIKDFWNCSEKFKIKRDKIFLDLWGESNDE